MNRIIILLAGAATLAACTQVLPETTTISGIPALIVAPNTILARGERLAQSRALVARNDTSVRAAWAALLDSARVALEATPPAVTQKRRVPPSGDMHDYMSMAPYWWPDTTKPGGLPFIRRDGEVYPESRADHDGTRMQRMASHVQTLALAWYLGGDERYAAAAERQLRVWFLDSATRMNPNLKYAQAVLGVNQGRGTGIIDTRDLPSLLDAVRILDGTPTWTATDRLAMSEWCHAYLRWMIESENGKDERGALNNHGTFYDEQVAALALFVGDTALARKTIGESATRRIDAQIKADGSQPLELERTRPLHYSLFNLDAYSMLAEMGRHVGVDLWHYTSPSGGSLVKAIRYVAPYADARRKWPTAQVTPATPDMFLPPLRRAASVLGDADLLRALRMVPSAVREVDRSHLSYPTVP